MACRDVRPHSPLHSPRPFLIISLRPQLLGFLLKHISVGIEARAMKPLVCVRSDYSHGCGADCAVSCPRCREPPSFHQTNIQLTLLELVLSGFSVYSCVYLRYSTALLCIKECKSNDNMFYCNNMSINNKKPFEGGLKCMVYWRF